MANVYAGEDSQSRLPHLMCRDGRECVGREPGHGYHSGQFRIDGPDVVLSGQTAQYDDGTTNSACGWFITVKHRSLVQITIWSRGSRAPPVFSWVLICHDWWVPRKQCGGGQPSQLYPAPGDGSKGMKTPVG